MEKDLRNGQRWDNSPRGPDREGKPLRVKKAAKDALKVLTKQLAKEEKDPREYGYEGEMAKSQLKGILQHAKQLHDILKPNTDLPEWVQSKITLAYDYIQTATDYMSTEMNEQVQINELSKKTLGNYIKSAKKDVRQAGKDSIRSSEWDDDKMKQDANKMTNKRYRGINMAVDKLTKEEVDLEEGDVIPFKKKKEEAGGDELLIVIKKKLSDEGGAAAFKPLKDAATKIGINLTPQMLKNMPGVSQHEDGDYILKEEVAANAVGGGNIAAVGIDHPNRPGSGEPGMSPRAVKRYRNSNARQAPTVGRKTLTQFMQGTR